MITFFFALHNTTTTKVLEVHAEGENTLGFSIFCFDQQSIISMRTALSLLQVAVEPPSLISHSSKKSFLSTRRSSSESVTPVRLR